MSKAQMCKDAASLVSLVDVANARIHDTEEAGYVLELIISTEGDSGSTNRIRLSECSQNFAGKARVDSYDFLPLINALAAVEYEIHRLCKEDEYLVNVVASFIHNKIRFRISRFVLVLYG